MALRLLLTKIITNWNPFWVSDVTVLADTSCVRGKCFYLCFESSQNLYVKAQEISNGRETVKLPVVYVQFTVIIKNKPRMQAKHLHKKGSPHTFQADLECFRIWTVTLLSLSLNLSLLTAVLVTGSFTKENRFSLDWKWCWIVYLDSGFGNPCQWDKYLLLEIKPSKRHHQERCYDSHN